MVGKLLKLAVVVVEPLCLLSLPEVEKNDDHNKFNKKQQCTLSMSVNDYVIFNELLKSGNFLYMHVKKKTIPTPKK